MRFCLYTKTSTFSKKLFLCEDGIFRTEREIKKLGLNKHVFTDRRLMAFCGQMFKGQLDIKKFVYYACKEEDE